MDAPTTERLAADLRTLRLLWLAISMGVVVMTAVMAFLVRAGGAGGGELYFYANALVNMGALVAAFAVQRRLAERTLPAAAAYDEAARAIRTAGLVSLAVMEGSALFAGVMALVTGEVVNLAFVVPFFAFAALFWPSDTRYAQWLSLAPFAR